MKVALRVSKLCSSVSDQRKVAGRLQKLVRGRASATPAQGGSQVYAQLELRAPVRGAEFKHSCVFSGEGRKVWGIFRLSAQ